MRRRFVVRRAIQVAASLAAALTGALAAQSEGRWYDADELPARVFDTRDGVPRAVLHKVKALPDRSLWLGTDAGLYTFDGRRWRPFAVPDSVGEPSVKDMAMTPDGVRWFAFRRGILRDSAGVQQWFRLPNAPVWTLVTTRAFGGGIRLIGSLRRGLVQWEGGRFVPLPLPDGQPDTDLVIAQTTRERIPSFWVGSLAGGVARFKAGAWQRFGPTDGLPDGARVQHFAAGPSDDPFEIVATTVDALYGFDGRRWVRLQSGGGIHLRSARVRRDGRFETWLALTNGALLSDGGTGRWRAVRPGGRVPSGSPQALSVIREEDGSFLVFVGYRGGELARFRVGRASVPDAPLAARGRSVRALFEDPDGTLHFSAAGGGLFRLVPGGGLQQMNDSLDVARFLRATPAVGGGLWAASHHFGAWRFAAGQWQPDAARGDSAVELTALGEGPGPDGRPALIAGTAQGTLQVRGPATWVPWPAAPISEPVRAILADTLEGVARLWVADASRLIRWDGTRWQAITVALPPGEELADLVLSAPGSAPRGAWLVTAGGTLFWVNAAATAGQLVQLPAWLERRSRSVRTLAADADGTLLFGTGEGLLRVVPRADRMYAAVTALYADEDGLPSADITAIGLRTGRREAWLGTVSGPARLRLDLTRPPVTAADLRVALSGLSDSAAALPDGVTLPWAEHDLRLSLALRTDYREDAVRFRVVLNGPLRLVQEWSRESDLDWRGLPAGNYEARIWAVRGFGDPVGPVTRTFGVAPPIWRGPLALLLYALGAGLVVWGITAWRTAALRQRQRVLLDNERRLAESERRFRVLFERSTDAQLLTDGARVVAANPAAWALLGSRDGRGSAADLTGCALVELMPQLALASPPGTDGIETDARSVDGEPRPVLLRSTDVPVEGATIRHLALQDLRDVRRLATERELLEHQLRESQRLEALGTLAGGVAHDFNNLLTVIRNGAEMARDAEARGERDPESFEAILTASARARDLVRQILAFSRRLPTRRDRLIADDLLRGLQPMLRASMPPAVRVVVEPRAPGAVLVGDETQLTQVLVNLATNAEYAMRGRSNAVLTMRTDLVTLPGEVSPRHRPLPNGRYVRLRVTDTGAGIRDEIRQRIFEPFFTTKPVGEGTGLGLSVLHGIVVAHEGSVAVESVPEEGTTFELLLPLADQATTGEPQASEPEHTSTPTARILLVDDEQLVLKATDRILRRHGYAVTAMGRGLNAQRLLESDAPFDLLVTDLNMPDVSGVVLATSAQRRDPPLPVVMLTGFAGEVAAELSHVAVCEVVEKPYEVDALLAAVARALAAAPA